MNEELKTSPQGYELIQTSESFRSNAYPDPASGGSPWTIAWGHTTGVQPGDVCDSAQGLLWLQEDVSLCEQEIYRSVTFQLNQNEFDALVDFIFNLGDGNFEKSTLLKYLNAGDIIDASAEFPKWDKASGKVVQGLLARRNKEVALFNLPIEGDTNV